MPRTPTPGDDPYSRDPYEGIDPLEGRGADMPADAATEPVASTGRLDDRPSEADDADLPGATADELFEDAPSEPSPDELEEEAERRGLGRGLIIGVIAAGLIALILLWLFNFGPLRPAAPPDNTVPVTILPADGTLVPEPSASGPADTGPASAPPTASATPSSSTPSTEPGPSTTGDPSGEVPVALTRWNWIAEQQMISVAGFLPTTVEAGGTCTLTASREGRVVTATGPATPDAHTTVCAINLTVPSLESGTWDVVLAYDGPAGTGVSPSAQVEVVR